MNKKVNTSQLVLLGLMTAILLLMAYTPLGYLNIGPLAITFNMIPVAITAITIGPVGGAITGAVFGLTSFLQCMGIGGGSVMGTALFHISPALTFLQCFLPRILDGFLLGHLFRSLRKASNVYAAAAVTGFCSAFLNTLFFMGSLVLLFGRTEYLQGLIAGRNIIVFICAFVGVNAVCEMIAATILTSAVGAALYRARLLPAQVQAKAAA